MAGLSLLAAVLLPQAAPLQYRLQPGHVLEFRERMVVKSERGERIRERTHRVRVVRRNDDGTCFLLLSWSGRAQVRRPGGRIENGAVTDERWAWVELAPDGSFRANPTIQMGYEPSLLFPPLPRGGRARAWKRALPVDGLVFEGKITGEGAAAGPGPSAALRIEYRRHTHFTRVYERDEELRFVFDRRRGLPQALEAGAHQHWPHDSQTRTEIRLARVARAEPAALEQLAADFEAAFAAKRAYDEATFGARTKRAELRKRVLDEARRALAAEAARLGGGPAKTFLERLLRAHGNRVKYVEFTAKRFAKILGRPSPEWTAQDLEGHPHSLAELRGKIVVLDFWYRGCGWCLRAMPAIRRLARRFGRMPVAVVGISKDEDPADMAFTIARMGLDYPNWRGPGVPKLYGITGFPTLLVLDREGVVRDAHLGFDPDLEQKIAASVERLLIAREGR